MSKSSPLAKKALAKKKAAPKKSAPKKQAKKPAPKKAKKQVASSDEDDSDSDADSDAEEEEEEEEVAQESDDDDEDEDEEDDEELTGIPSKSTSTRRKKISNKAEDALDFSLAPMTDIYSIFDHLTEGFKDELSPALKKLDRPLRVATMCSGTEAPILALRLMFRSLEAQTGVQAEMQHVFSAEIEPFKQAYIERNFAPPVLFRDVTELPNVEARTAYGAMVSVPGDVDILIAGTSCVDYSNLNGIKKGIHDGGESGRTFFGMLRWVDKHRPPIVILENVKNAPWPAGVTAFDDIGYSAKVVFLDTKKYYVPHTRMRGYLVAFPRRDGEGNGFFKPRSDKSSTSAARMAEDWVDRVQEAARPASAPTEAFLLNTDDPRIHRARQELSQVKVKADGSRRAAVDWIKCEQRHALARHEEQLGDARPLTDWQDTGGKPTLPDGAWQDWGEAQTERVLDLMDISYLRQAIDGVDITYKSAIWNLSQNVDRTTASKLYGITPCLTPNMIPYLTNRGGPVVGVEALALQGLPIDELLLTRENTDQLADLAGNAMSSTVVGTAIAAALAIAGHTLLDRKYPDAEVEMASAGAATDAELEARFRGADRLVEHPVDLASVKTAPADLLARAHRSARKCTCEGRQGTAKDAVVACSACGHSSCQKHAGKPVHKYQEVESVREAPAKFEADLKQFLPMRLTVPGFEREAMEEVVDAAREKGVKLDSKMVKRYIDVVVEALEGAEFHFRQIDRRETWSVVYAADKARLELHFEKTGIEWRLFAKPPADITMVDELRRQLEQPIARLTVAAGSTDVLSGSWELKLPLTGNSGSVKLDFSGKEYTKSWRALLEIDAFLEEKRPAEIKVAFQGEKELLGRDIDGTYVHEPHCGTATHNLYRRVEPAQEAPLFLFFDPSAYLQKEHDSFVFAETCSRTDSNRQLVAAIDPKWRLPTSPAQGGMAAFAEPKVVISEVWSALAGSFISAGGLDVDEASQFSTIETGFDLAVSTDKCAHAEVLLNAQVPLAKAPSADWAKESWHEVDIQHEGADVFNKLAWMFPRIPNWDHLKTWQGVEVDTIPSQDCQCCAPLMPDATWIRQFKFQDGAKSKKWQIKIIAREDGLESAEYERALKNRPEPILVHTRQQSTKFHFRVGLNAVSLAHRALAQLPKSTAEITYERSKPDVEWRLTTTSNVALGREPGFQFSLSSNRDDPEAENPKLFVKYKLRPEQLRSLHWMIEQEANPQPWIEEEVAEATLPQLGWHAEAKATRKAYVRGGVVADAVGYGKTAITLGLIAARREADAELPDEEDRIPIKATLIVIPSHLCTQWKKEVAKFTKPALDVLMIKNMTDLKKATVEAFEEADVIIVSESLFRSMNFWPHLADFAAAKRDVRTDKKAGRYFRYTVGEALTALGVQVMRFNNDGASAARRAIERARANRNDDFQQEVYVQPKSKKDANAKAKKQDPDAKPVAPPKLPAKPTDFSREKKEAVNDKDWHLDSSEVKKNWKKLKCPPLALFSYARVVVDEFSYSEGAALAGIHALRGRARWILSGTPPLDDFSHVKFIADMLHVHLGCDDDNEGTHPAVKTRSDERTKAEEFRSFCDVRSKAWHARRDQVAQRFLDQFARQNIAEIEEIPLEKELIGIHLPGAEMAIYRELEHHLYSVDPNLAKLAKIKAENMGDREERLREALGQSSTPEEALLKRCSHFSLDLPPEKIKEGEAPDVCEYIHDLRDHQRAACEDELEKLIAIVAYEHRKAIAAGYYRERPKDTKSFVAWAEELETKGFGDAETDVIVKALAFKAGVRGTKVGEPDSGSFDPQNEEPIKRFNKPAKKASAYDEWVAERTYLITHDCATLRKLTKELIGRVRSQRYFVAVRKVLRNTDAAANEDHIILSCCGHEGPAKEVEAGVLSTKKCFVPKCNAQVAAHNIIRGDDLGTDRASGHFGYKLETLVTLINKTPKNDRVLVFVQFQDLYDKVHEALTVYGIPVTTISGGANKKSKALDEFQDPNAKGKKVLLLHATTSSAAGANLTVANHAFFVSPLLTETKSNYKALSTQAVGRIHRYGQLKTANVVHLLVHGTLDMKIYAERNGICEERDYTYPEKMAAVMAAQPKQRAEIVNPLREKEYEWVAPVRKEKKGKAKAKAAGAGKAKPVAKAESDSEEEAAESEDDSPAPKKGAKGKGKAKAKPAPKKAKVIVVDDSDEEEEEAESSDEEEDEVIDLAESDSDEEEYVSKKGKVNDDDDFEMAVDESPTSRRTTERRASALHKPKYAVDDDEEEEEEEERSPSPSPVAKKTKKRALVLSDSSDDEDDAPIASSSKAKGKGKAAAQPSSSAKSAPKTKRKDASAERPTKRRKSVFDCVEIPVRSPKASPKGKGKAAAPSAEKEKTKKKPAAPAAKKSMRPGTLDSFFGKKPAAVARSATASTAASLKEQTPVFDETEEEEEERALETPATEMSRELGAGGEEMEVDDEE
ncbi:hypothetical protein JCM6882_008514 [Rhodosporidiobolus microsporus]